MPADPEQKMDELLKACAKLRREQAGDAFALHPATRQLLQSEVRRLIPPAPEKSGGGGFFNLRRLLLSGAALATVAICAVLAIKENAPLQPPPLARQAKLAEPADQKQSMPAPMTTPASTLSLRDDLESETRKRQIARQDVYLSNISLEKSKAIAIDGQLNGTKESSDLLAVGGGNEMNTRKPDGTPLAREEAEMASPQAAPAAPFPGKPAADSLAGFAEARPVAPATGYGMTPSSTSQQPSSVAAAEAPQPLLAAKKELLDENKDGDKAAPTDRPALPAILTSFKIQLEGDQIRLTDTDGSTYVGRITALVKQQSQAAAVAGTQMFSNVGTVGGKVNSGTSWHVSTPSGVLAGSSNSLLQDATSKVQAQQQGDFSFRASGTNRSLKQIVVIEGTYFTIAVPPEQRGRRVAKASDMAVAAKRAAQNASAALSESSGVRIQGQAKIGNGETVNIDAIAVSPPDVSGTLK